MAKKPGRRTALIAMLEAKFGDGGEWVDLVARVARGQTIAIETEMKGVVKLVTPDLDQMLDAANTLLDRQHGRARATLDVEVAELPKGRNYDALTLQELETLERLTRKLDAPIVDAQFSLTEGKKS